MCLKEDNGNYRTYQIRLKNSHPLYDYFSEQSRLTKNLYNHANFFIRQVYTALTQEKPWQPNQQTVMETLTHYLPIINENQQQAWEKRAEETKSGTRKQNRAKPRVFSSPTKKKSYLGYPFLNALFRTMQEENYRALSSQTAQGVLKNLHQNWQSFFASQKEYQKDPDKFLGKPRIPHYLDQDCLKEITFTNQDCRVKNAKSLQFPGTQKSLEYW